MTSNRTLKGLTPKQQVLKKYPKAVAWQTPIRRKWLISTPDWAGKDIGESRRTANAAWADAAKRIKP